MDITRVYKDNKLYHFSEFENEFKEILFFRILTHKNKKYIAFESSSYLGCDGFYLIDFNECYKDYNNNRKKYIHDINNIKNNSDINDYVLTDLKEFCRFDISRGISKLKYINNIKTDVENLFYHNDFMLYNYGNGRELLNYKDVNVYTKDGYYYSYNVLILKDNIDKYNIFSF